MVWGTMRWSWTGAGGRAGDTASVPSAPCSASPRCCSERCPRAWQLILPWGFAALSLPDVSSLDTVLEFLKEAFSCISHCPPGTLYSQICQLLALATGSQDPLSTAYLLSESVSITTRHQLLSILHRKLQ